jgi:hypothetical protein
MTNKAPRRSARAVSSPRPPSEAPTNRDVPAVGGPRSLSPEQEKPVLRMVESSRYRRLVGEEIEICGRRFAKDGNPLWVWRAIGWCLLSSPTLATALPLPDWCLIYLAEAASDIHEFVDRARTHDETLPPINPVVLAALKFGGRGGKKGKKLLNGVLVGDAWSSRLSSHIQSLDQGMSKSKAMQQLDRTERAAARGLKEAALARGISWPIKTK